MVDVETGDEPRPMRTRDEEPAGPPDPLVPQGVHGRSVKRPDSRPAHAGMPLRRAHPKVSTHEPRSVPARSRIADTDWSSAMSGIDEVLWLDGPSGDPFAEPSDSSTRIAPWRRGLRG